MITYNLAAEGVWDEVLQIAARRSAGKENYKSNYCLSAQSDIIGTAGEMAFELATGLKMDRRQLAGGDGGFDFILPDGKLVDVKTRAAGVRCYGDLTYYLADKDLFKKCDLFVFAKTYRYGKYALTSRVSLVGFIERWEVQDIARGKSRNGRVTWSFKLSQVRPIEELFTLDNDKKVTWV